MLLFKIFNMLLSYMHSPKDADGMINNYDPDQMASSGAV